MSKLQRPKNSWAKALWVLNQSYMGGVNMTKVLTHYEPTFWKFQTRLSDLVAEYPKLKIQKTAVPFKSKITGKSGYTTWYTPLCPESYLTTLYNQINENGLKGKIIDKK